MIKKLILLLLVALLAACEQAPSEAVPQTTAVSDGPSLPDGVTLVEEFTGHDDGFSITYSKYVLDNGLTVVLHEDHSDPMVHVDVTYHVGSAREEPGRSGFAHFFVGEWECLTRPIDKIGGFIFNVIEC